MRWLRGRHWHFVIRLQGKNKVCWAGQDWIKINRLPLQPGQTHVIGWVRLTIKHNAGWYWLLLNWQSDQDEPWYLISDQARQAELLRVYRNRMWIVEMYGDMRGHGFDLETTHLKHTKRITCLVLAV